MFSRLFSFKSGTGRGTARFLLMLRQKVLLQKSKRTQNYSLTYDKETNIFIPSLGNWPYVISRLQECALSENQASSMKNYEFSPDGKYLVFEVSEVRYFLRLVSVASLMDIPGARRMQRPYTKDERPFYGDFAAWLSTHTRLYKL